MKIDIYFINAFTKQVNAGNPACVVPLKKWLPHSTMLAIAKENKVAETHTHATADMRAVRT